MARLADEEKKEKSEKVSGVNASGSGDGQMIDTGDQKAGKAGFGQKEKKNPRCAHAPNEKCVHCLGATEEDKEEDKKCKHGPSEKCLHCLGITKNNWQDVKKGCDHKPGEKCPNCIDEG